MWQVIISASLHSHPATKRAKFNKYQRLFKLSKPDSPNGFWKLSEEIFNWSNKSEQVNYLLANCDVAMRQNILF